MSPGIGFLMSAKYRIAFKTLGCKLNQYETVAIREDAASAGFDIVKFSEPADVYVVNTCTVTGRADYHSRQQIRKARRRNPDAYIVVCGCYCQVNHEAIQSIEGVDLIVGNIEKSNLLDLIPVPPVKETPPRVMIAPVSSSVAIPFSRLTQFGGLTRAFVKIQDGCDYRCAYCIVPDARGPSRSKPVADVVGEVRGFTERGFGEIVLTGVHLGCYGKDIGITLTHLLEKLVPIEKLHRLRLSSIEPVDMTGELIGFITRDPKICRHVHLPLQSGHPGILESMGRPYTPAEYGSIVRRLKDADPGWCIGADVITGFPGEGYAEFSATYDFIESLPLSYLHVFTYSERKGTRAADFPGKVPHTLRDERNRILKKLSAGKREEFYTSQIGIDLDLLIENASDSRTGLLVGLSDNYLRILLEGPDEFRGTFHTGILEKFIPDRELGLGHL